MAAILRRSVPDGHSLAMESNCISVSLVVYRLYRSTGPEGQKAPARHGRGGAYHKVVDVVRELFKVLETGP